MAYINRAYVYMCEFFFESSISQMRYHVRVSLLCCDNFLFFLIDTQRRYDVINILFVVDFILINFSTFFPPLPLNHL